MKECICRGGRRKGGNLALIFVSKTKRRNEISIHRFLHSKMEIWTNLDTIHTCNNMNRIHMNVVADNQSVCWSKVFIRSRKRNCTRIFCQSKFVAALHHSTYVDSVKCRLLLIEWNYSIAALFLSPVSPLSFDNELIRLLCCWWSGDSAQSLRIRFSVPYRCNFGNHLRVIGNVDTIGSWNVEKALRMDWTDGDLWIAEAELPM